MDYQLHRDSLAFPFRHLCTAPLRSNCTCWCMATNMPWTILNVYARATDSDCGYSDQWRIGCSFWWTLAWKHRLLLAHSSSKIVKYHTCNFSLKPLKCVQPLSFFQYFAGYSGRSSSAARWLSTRAIRSITMKSSIGALVQLPGLGPARSPAWNACELFKVARNWTMCLLKKSYCSGQRYDILLIMMKGMILSGDVWVVVKSGHPTCWMIQLLALGVPYHAISVA